MFVKNACLAAIYFGLAFGINREHLFTVSDMCYQHNNGVISDVYDILSLLKCSFVCAKENCRSFLFDGVTQRCITYTVNVSITTSGCGWKYAEIYTENSSIPVTDVTCEVPGYSYDSTTDTCVLDCMSYGNTFGEYVGYALAMLNNEVITGSSEQACKDSCVAATAFVCRSAELSTSGSCYLSVETAQTKPTEFVVDHNYIFWHRNCA